MYDYLRIPLANGKYLYEQGMINLKIQFLNAKTCHMSLVSVQNRTFVLKYIDFLVEKLYSVRKSKILDGGMRMDYKKELIDLISRIENPRIIKSVYSFLLGILSVQ